jgi:hypothetical protein
MPQARNVGGHLLRRKLPALARFRSLGNLDFQFVGVHQVLGGHTKPSRGHLLHAIVGFALLGVDAGILSAFPGIASSAEAVHGDGQGAVRLRRDCAQRHRLCAKPAQQRGLGLDFIQRNRGLPAHLQQIANRDRFPFVGQRAVELKILIRRRLDVAVHAAHDLRRIRVTLAVVPKTIEPAVLQGRSIL